MRGSRLAFRSREACARRVSRVCRSGLDDDGERVNCRGGGGRRMWTNASGVSGIGRRRSRPRALCTRSCSRACAGSRPAEHLREPASSLQARRIVGRRRSDGHRFEVQPRRRADLHQQVQSARQPFLTHSKHGHATAAHEKLATQLATAEAATVAGIQRMEKRRVVDRQDQRGPLLAGQPALQPRVVIGERCPIEEALRLR